MVQTSSSFAALCNAHNDSMMRDRFYWQIYHNDCLIWIQSLVAVGIFGWASLYGQGSVGLNLGVLVEYRIRSDVVALCTLPFHWCFKFRSSRVFWIGAVAFCYAVDSSL